MAKIVFDQPKNLVETVQPVAKGKFGGDCRTEPGPVLPDCCECGAQTTPQWREDRDVFCARCVPDSLRHPERNPT